jgi:shikimate dehydrogenase
MAKEPRACVIGHPVAHSRSPMIHGHWLRTLGLPGSYGREDVAPGDIENFLRSLRERGYAGANVTIPHKEAAFRVADRTTDRARAVEAVNTLYYEGDVLVGDNTDGEGFLASLEEGCPGWARKARCALVLGAGGAARGVIAALRGTGIPRIVVANRTRERAEALARLFGPGVEAIAWADLPEALREADLLVNTTSLGMKGHPPLDLDLHPLKEGAVVTDIVYVPLLTDILVRARASGHPVVGGLGMLLYQAVPGFEKWFGVRPRVTPELRALVEADVEPPR